jgi:hypothetical protein
MIAPFVLHDLLLLARSQKQYVSLCPVEALVYPQSPVQMALASLLTLREVRPSTFVLKNHPRGEGRHLQGFVQVEQSAVRPELYVRHVSPQLDDSLDTWEETRTIWNRLLSHAVSTAQERGLHRVFACAPDDSPVLNVLRATGFSVYAREQLYRLAPDAHPQAVARASIRPEQGTDTWAINQLYRRVVPHLVQQAEALGGSESIEVICGPIAWEQGEGFVLESQGDIVAYGHLMPGHTGHWLTVLIDPSAYDRAAELLDYGLALLNYYPPLPVYCAVREYQGGIQAPLIDQGFESLATHCRMVHHTTVRVKEPARSLVPALEKRAKASTPTASHTEGT